MIEIKDLTINDITPDMLLSFNHHELITKMWVKNNDQWELTEVSEVHEWNKEKKMWVAEYIRSQIEAGGSTVAAFDGDVLVGFCCVDGYLMGKTAKYANLTMLFVDDNRKRKGIGRKLFDKICENAARMGADKLFMSAVASFETIAFYFAMGCEDAREIITDYVDTEQDRYLEYSLATLK